MLRRWVVRKNERGVLRRDGDFEAILAPGRYWFVDPWRRLSLQRWPADAPMTDHETVDYLLQEHAATAAEHLVTMILGEDEAGLRYENDVLVDVLPPASRHCWWRGFRTQRLERIDLKAQTALPAELASHLVQPALRGRAVGGLNGILLQQVPAGHLGVVRIDGEVRQVLAPGLAAYWRFNRDVQLELVDTRLQAMEVSGQEILSRDKVALRINLVANWRYSDVLRAFAGLSKPAEYLYRELQFGLRAAVGTRSLDELLESKQAIDESVAAHAVRKLNGLGIEVVSVGVRDIVLPGEMKTLLAQVVEAQKAAEANVIRRREETAATRSLLNTAKVMEDNPTALRLKELETLERIAERIDRISVFGGLDQVLDGMVRLGARPEARR
ncbi:slipin family protein [Accumulibacter sp.]|uniref:slipin family protein n=1 Tax=Accumulibacter sp. TaxID=2053492 RepID=UPI002608F670|nr:slipin family protein [Accumulibacter sp.]